MNAASEDRHFMSDSYEDQRSPDNNPAAEIDIQHYLRILRKHKWAISLFTAVITALAGYYAFTATPVYSATSTLLIESQSNNIVQFDELVGLDTENQDYYQTQFELLRSRGLAVRVINHMNLWSIPELSPVASAQLDSNTVDAQGDSAGALTNILNKTKSLLGLAAGEDSQAQSGDVVLDLQESSLVDPFAISNVGEQTLTNANDNVDAELGEEIQTNSRLALGLDASSLDRLAGQLTDDQQIVVANFMSRLSIEPLRKTKLVKISFESEDPVLAARVANTVGEQYIESFLDAKLELTTKASTWLNSRLAALKETLDASEDKLIAFKQENGLVDVDGSVGRLNEQELFLVTAELAQARSDLSGKADLYRQVQALENQPELLQSIPSIQADSLVQLVKVDQGQAQRNLDELRNRYGDRHPRVIDATSQLQSLNNTLEGHINRVVGTMAKDFQLAQQRVASIEAKLATGKQEIQAIGTKKFELDELEREVQTNRVIYDTFFSRITEAKSADGLETANARISDSAVAPISPVKPKKQLIIALAALASLVLSMLMAFLYEQMDDTIKGTADVEGKLGVRMLGILPLVKDGFFGKKQSLPLNPLETTDKKGRFSEAVNTARTALCMDDPADAPRKIIMVTSSVPSEGKSTTSINLAYSLSQLERVLLIDCDLRRPTIARAAGLDRNKAGLSNLITQTASAKNCITRGVFGGALDVLPSGPVPDQPLELLSSKRFAKILQQLSRHYDRIILDCAPTQAVSDAFVLSRLCDSVVYAVKSHDTSVELVKRGLQRLKQVDAHIAGVLITQVDIDKIVSYGGDYYYQGYYDYYGYSEKDKPAREKRDGSKIRLTPQELMDIRKDDSDVNLDLDYGYEPLPQSMQRDSRLDDAAEFDLTADLDSDRQRVRGGPKPWNRKDDLEIL